MEILAIGNSFSQDATRYLHQIARADGVKLNVVNLYIPGCPLERHYRNMLSGERNYKLECNGEQTGFNVSLQEALLNRSWDVITIQQASPFSFDPETYRPYAKSLAEMIRKYSPKAKLLLQETWFYEEGSSRRLDVAGYTSWKEMLKDIQTAYARIAEEIEADGIIPSGTLFGQLLDAGVPKVHRDTFHASYGLGRYALGLLWYRILTGNSVICNPFLDLDESITTEERDIVKNCVESI